MKICFAWFLASDFCCFSMNLKILQRGSFFRNRFGKDTCFSQCSFGKSSTLGFRITLRIGKFLVGIPRMCLARVWDRARYEAPDDLRFELEIAQWWTCEWGYLFSDPNNRVSQITAVVQRVLWIWVCPSILLSILCRTFLWIDPWCWGRVGLCVTESDSLGKSP